MTTCTTCGAALPAAARFCSVCGAAVAEVPDREARKTVTLLFCDITGSTALGERLDPELLRRALRRYFEQIEAVIVAHGGLVEKFAGDAVMAVFGLPAVHEDDALRAVRAALEVRERLPALARETGIRLDFRTGLNTGEVATGEGQTLVTGDAVNVAARLQQAAAPGEILLGAATERLVRGRVETDRLAPLRVHGREEEVTAFRLRALAAEEPSRAAAPFVGRGRELRLLHDAYDRAVEARELHLFTLLGPAGIGKSRLAGEFVVSLGPEPTVAAGRCLSYGRGITFWPLVEILEQLGDEGSEVRRRVLEGSASSPDELAWEVRAFLERRADERPLVLVVDDLHWAEPALLDLLDRMVELSRGVPILLLCLARAELLEERPGWAGGRLNATTVLLDGLSGGDAERLVEDVPADDRARLVDIAGGNPLFLEELAAARAETGVTQSTPLIQALLQARLDRLPPSERELLGCASVAGLSFERDALAALVAEVEAPLRSLTVKDLIRPRRGGRAYGFRHELIRDAAYAALPKSERARLHEGFARWIDAHGETLAEREEIAAHHLEQAALLARELGARDLGLSRRAADRLAAAARSARRRMDVAAARQLAERALALLPEDDVARPPIEVDAAILATLAGDNARGTELLDDAERHGDRHCLARALVARIEGRYSFDPDTLHAALEQARVAALPVLEELHDDEALAVFWRAVNVDDWGDCRSADAANALRRQVEHARRAGDRALEAGARMAELYQRCVRMPAAETLPEWKRLAQEYPGEPQVAIGELLSRVETCVADRRFDEARELVDALGAGFRRLGLELSALVDELQFRSDIELRAGNLDEAARLLIAGIAELRRRGERGFLSTALVHLARVRLAQGRPVEAVELSREGEETGGASDRFTRVLAAAVRAHALARLGDVDGAVSAARDAVELAAGGDFLSLHAEAALALADALATAGDAVGAAEAAEQAADAFERRGQPLDAADARSLAAAHA